MNSGRLRAHSIKRGAAASARRHYTRPPARFDMLHTIIFVTGGAILALELLSSRILTPYFGVSLYIWSGILSITLVSLAIGYWWGGRLATANRGSAQRLAFLFALMPAVAATSAAQPASASHSATMARSTSK